MLVVREEEGREGASALVEHCARDPTMVHYDGCEAKTLVDALTVVAGHLRLLQQLTSHIPGKVGDIFTHVSRGISGSSIEWAMRLDMSQKTTSDTIFASEHVGNNDLIFQHDRIRQTMTLLFLPSLIKSCTAIMMPESRESQDETRD